MKYCISIVGSGSFILITHMLFPEQRGVLLFIFTIVKFLFITASP